MRETEVIASNEACKITRTSSGYEFATGYKHEVHDTERGKVLSRWESSEALLERLEDADHRLTEDFRAWLTGEGDDE